MYAHFRSLVFASSLLLLSPHSYPSVITLPLVVGCGFSPSRPSPLLWSFLFRALRLVIFFLFCLFSFMYVLLSLLPWLFIPPFIFLFSSSLFSPAYTSLFFFFFACFRLCMTCFSYSCGWWFFSSPLFLLFFFALFSCMPFLSSSSSSSCVAVFR